LFLLFCVVVPVDGDNPKTISNNDVIIVIDINGINTIIHEITPKPFLHITFNTIVNIIIIINFNKAELYKFLNISSIICVSENATYKIAGGHNFSIIILSL
jgi:hypothetical protein